MPQITKTAPAFQFYASDTMADKRYRNMSLEERGLFLSLLCECWVNRSVPSDPQSISKWLGFTKDAIEAALTEHVLSFFRIEKNEIASPELERYRLQLEERREKMSQGGKKGAKGKWNPPGGDSYPTSPPNGVPMGSRVEKSGNEKNRYEMKRGESLVNKEDLSDNENEQWITEYESYSSSADDPIPF